MLRAEVELTVPFHDIDLLNIAWHGHYCKYIEIARCAMLDKIGYGYMAMKDTGYVWPIVDLQLRFIRPARFEQRIIAEAQLVEYEYRMKIKYRILDAETREVLAKGHSIQAAVSAVSGEMCYASPPVFLEKLGIKIEAP
ncbi:thioesterase superfamily protein [Methylomonas albis]|uniref:Acyl-CoA thioesterase n=1 Tax=Methylomonas albis TaxID=1854563 RepID=A0ABR9D051_9GAMM|nr:acyl-CoA thioesterase [Methylomonas albis]MBD9356335.1 acyl-CoA thioesterase [Methylomonas albis]CAD6879417.1 thioesterase superfamily protein [Methylomonas albis]